jgi:hypothetical protein
MRRLGERTGLNYHDVAPVTNAKTACKLRAAVSDPQAEQRPQGEQPTQRDRLRATRRDLDLKRWAFVLVPLVALVELAAHAVQVRSVTPAADWTAARDFVASQVRPDDLIAFAPRWIDPVGREHFGPQLANLEREAPADTSRYPRAFEVGIRGAHVPALAGWRRADKHRFGDVTVTTWENPTPAHVIEDLVSMVSPQRMRVSRGDADCPFAHSAPLSGGLGFGPGVPADRFACSGGGAVALSVVTDLDYVPHRCIYAPPPGGAPLRLQFQGVRMGHSLHGHHALYVEAERGRSGGPVTLTFKIGDDVVGTVVHRDGDGWKPFEFDTADRAGTVVDLVAEVGAPSGERRMYCFEADTR